MPYHVVRTSSLMMLCGAALSLSVRVALRPTLKSGASGRTASRGITRVRHAHAHRVITGRLPGVVFPVLSEQAPILFDTINAIDGGLACTQYAESH